jgi:hypothetical protein
MGSEGIEEQKNPGGNEGAGDCGERDEGEGMNPNERG